MVAERDAMMPLGWLPGAEFRLANIDGDDHLFYLELFEGNPHKPLPQKFIAWDVYAVHRIFITEDWTTVQFCPWPTDWPDAKAWVQSSTSEFMVGFTRHPRVLSMHNCCVRHVSLDWPSLCGGDDELKLVISRNMQKLLCLCV